MVHASLRALGPVAGGADGVLDALIETLGANGTLLMALGADPDEPFVASETPVDIEDMGVLAAVFRTRPGVHVSDHAAARYAAYGPLRKSLIDHAPLHHYHGPGSVLQRLTDHGGDILRLGADIDTVTVTHWAEYVADIPDKRHVRVRYVRGDIGEQWIDSLDDTNGIKDWPQGDYFSQILLDFLAAGHAARGPVGACQAELFSAPTFVDFAVRWMEKHLA